MEHASLTELLARRMQLPQRHRLLHGYPLVGAMKARPADPGWDLDVGYAENTDRGLLIGVLPHPFCNPRVEGCGFCTFAHRPYDGAQVRDVVACVEREIAARVANQPYLSRRKVAGVYFGGGTANLTPPTSFRQLCRTLARHFDLRDAQVTLEGVPRYFLHGTPRLVEILREELPARHFRLSMGIQTFDAERLRAMGREAFGDVGTFAEVVELAHSLGMTASADLLFNLPHQTLDEMRRDVDRAIALGLDHLGLYHLVLFRGLGTEWSRDPEMLAGLPDNESAATNWMDLRERLLAAGFLQTTLTNFERAAFRDHPDRFTYEEFSFQANRYDMIGFGPSAISFAAAPDYASGWKILNPDDARAYLSAVDRNATCPWDRHFDYRQADMLVFHVTRRLAALCVDNREHKQLFGNSIWGEFDNEIAVMRAAELLVYDTQTLRPTPRGMFYGDAMASVFADRRSLSRELRVIPAPRNQSNARGYM